NARKGGAEIVPGRGARHGGRGERAAGHHGDHRHDPDDLAAGLLHLRVPPAVLLARHGPGPRLQHARLEAHPARQHQHGGDHQHHQPADGDREGLAKGGRRGHHFALGPRLGRGRTVPPFKPWLFRVYINVPWARAAVSSAFAVSPVRLKQQHRAWRIPGALHELQPVASTSPRLPYHRNSVVLKIEHPSPKR
uniref:Uncharacterized protein n=1 Tax=Anopheles atroparvus TaxID=41427 RepID=A0AAG5D2E2_ANOAO